jgi:hypothetical protein
MRKIIIRRGEQKHIAEIENHEEKDRRDSKDEKLDPPPLSVLPRSHRPFEIGKDQGKDQHDENRIPIPDRFEGGFDGMDPGVEEGAE